MGWRDFGVIVHRDLAAVLGRAVPRHPITQPTQILSAVRTDGRSHTLPAALTNMGIYFLTQLGIELITLPQIQERAVQPRPHRTGHCHTSRVISQADTGTRPSIRAEIRAPVLDRFGGGTHVEYRFPDV